jgi:ubiquinone/menaquinone biosynthesis C-methylase UbiE
MPGLELIPWVYDLALGISERGRFGAWRRWLPGGAAGRTLDLGSGTGRNLPWLPPEARAVALDPWRPLLQAARRRAPGVPLAQGRAEALPFRGGAFDTVLCGLVLCSVEDPLAALAEVRRVLRPGGTVRVLEHVRSTSPALARLQDLVQPAWTWCAGGCHPNRDTERTLATAGFEVEVATRVARGSLRRLVARPLR